MWKKYKDFLRKRTYRYLYIGSIIAMFMMWTILLEGAENIHLANVLEISIVIIILFISCFVMATFLKELGQRSAEMREELEREARERLREELKEEVKKELETGKK